MLALALALVVGCRRDDDGVPSDAGATYADAPVILISIDTLRADRLPVYGYDGVETPAIDALAADAVVFERAYSHYPLTLPAHASILTGLLPTEHGVRDNQGYELATEDVPYLPRILAEAGWATGAAVSAFVLRAATGLGDGFEHYDEPVQSGGELGLAQVQRPGTETLERALVWLDGIEDRPPFLFFHIYEPHSPYDPPAAFAQRYRNRYDGEVAAADAVVGRLVEALRERGLYDRAVVILLSDHGEGLGDHGEREHGVLLYREALEVPLILKLPGGDLAGRRSARPAQLADVVPTVLDLLGLSIPPGLPGRSLRELLLAGDEQPERSIYAETWYPRLHLGWSELTSVIEGPLHYIEGPDPELYDLVADPAETRNVLRDERRALGRLRAALEELERELAAPAPVDPETAARLAALGYAGGGGPAAADGPLPDPKSQIQSLERLGDVHRLMERGEHPAALDALEELLRDQPRMADARMAQALTLKRLGRPREALDAYRRVAEIRGMDAQLALLVAGLHLQLGELDAARDHAELALDDLPAGAHRQLSETALAADDLETATRHARAAAEARDGALAPLVQLARVLALGGDLAGARDALATLERERAGRASGDAIPGLDFVRGDLLARDGKADAAADAFRAELESFPQNVDAWARLAFLQAVAGRGDQAVATLRAMTETNPTPAAYAAAVKTLRALGDEGQAAALLAYARERFPEADSLTRL